MVAYKNPEATSVGIEAQDVSFELARGRYVGNFCADGQVDAHDVVKVYEAAATAGRPTLASAFVVRGSETSNLSR